MIPLLIISKDAKLVKNYVNNLKLDSLFFEIFPTTKEYSISDIKNINKETKVFHPKTRIYFLPDFHLSSIPAQNSFLKLLEEPPSKIQFILSTDNKNCLLPTIISRVKIVKLRQKESQNKVGQSIVQEIESIINRTAKNIPLITVKDKETTANILLQLIIFFRNKLGSDKKSPLVIKEIFYFNRLLENNNLNPQLTMDQVLIFIWKTYSMK